MKIFITGGAGYVGYKLVPMIIENQHEVTVLVLMYGENVLDKIKIKPLQGDIRDIKLLEK